LAAHWTKPTDGSEEVSHDYEDDDGDDDDGDRDTFQEVEYHHMTDRCSVIF